MAGNSSKGKGKSSTKNTKVAGAIVAGTLNDTSKPKKKLTKRAYKASIELNFIYGKEKKKKKIDPKYISYFAIMYDYLNQVIPTITMNISCPDSLYNLIIKYKKKGKFTLKLSYKNELAKSGVYKAAFSTQTFSYVLGNVNPNEHKNLNKEGDNSYRVINIGLISNKMINLNRRSYNGIYNNVDSNTLLALALLGLPGVVCEKIPYNTKYSTIIIPPINTRYKFIKFVENMHPFFDTDLNFFMDFKHTYITSNNPVDTKLSGNKDIVIKLVDLKSSESVSEGMKVSDSTIYVRVPTSQISINRDQYRESVVSKVVGIGSDDTVREYNITKEDDDDDSGQLTKEIYIRSDQPAITSNRIESYKYTISLYKENINGNIFTPNRIFTLKSDVDDYKKYNGKYKVINKKEIFKQKNGKFLVYVALTLVPVKKGVSLTNEATSDKEASKNTAEVFNSKEMMESLEMSVDPLTQAEIDEMEIELQNKKNAMATNMRDLLNEMLREVNNLLKMEYLAKKMSEGMTLEEAYNTIYDNNLYSEDQIKYYTDKEENSEQEESESQDQQQPMSRMDYLFKLVEEALGKITPTN